MKIVILTEEFQKYDGDNNKNIIIYVCIYYIKVNNIHIS